MGFNVAFGLTTYDEKPFTLDESYGRLRAYRKVWGDEDDNGRIKPIIFYPLNTR